MLMHCTDGCQKRSNELRVVASAVPHAEILEAARTELEAQGINLKIIVTDDYNMPNRALAEKEADANFFQHLPYLLEQVKQFKYPIYNAAAIELEPMGIYSRRIQNLADLREKAKIAIPNDPTNEARALMLLEREGLIGLDKVNNLSATVLNIVHNPKNIQFIEIDAAMAPRALEDVDAAVINTNYALQAKLSPLKDALVLEGKDSPYVNIVAIRNADKDRADLQALIKAMSSEKMRAFILGKYQGAIVPAF